MDKFKLVEKLKDKANVSYEEAKDALESSNWDILDAMLYLEEHGNVEKQSIREIYTNEYNKSYSNEEDLNKDKEKKYSNNSKDNIDFQGIFEFICRAIDTSNNIFLEIKRRGVVLLKFPLTVIILLLFFTFWVTIPIMITGLFFEVEFFLATKRVDEEKVDKINKVFAELSKGAKDILRKFTKHSSS